MQQLSLRQGRVSQRLFRPHIPALFLLSFSLVGCLSAPAPTALSPSEHLPTAWQTDYQPSDAQILDRLSTQGWLSSFKSRELEALVEEALASNFALKSAAANVERARFSVDVSHAALYPSLTAGLGVDRSEGANTQFSSNLSANWNLDLWGQLSLAERQVELSYGATQADFAQQKTELVANVVNLWLSLQEAQALLALNQDRLGTLRQNLEIIEMGYKSGLNEALDLYLARNDLHAQEANVASQLQQLTETQHQLEVLLGRYPNGEIKAGEYLQLAQLDMPASLPAQTITNRPDLQQSWLNVLASDAALAQAHLNKFPSFSLSAGYGGSSDQLIDIVSAGTLVWTLGASLAADLFDGGEKEALQNQAAADRTAAESTYLNALYTAFSEVEDALSNRITIEERLAAYESARENAERAESLAFERYQRGLEDYDTVLTAQRRLLDAQSSLISLQREGLVNFLNLNVALGFPFNSYLDTSAPADR